MVVPSVRSIEWLYKELEQLEESDPLRQIMQVALNRMLSAEADSVCGAPYGMPRGTQAQRQTARSDRPHRQAARRHRWVGRAKALPAR